LELGSRGAPGCFGKDNGVYTQTKEGSTFESKLFGYFRSK